MMFCWQFHSGFYLLGAFPLTGFIWGGVVQRQCGQMQTDSRNTACVSVKLQM